MEEKPEMKKIALGAILGLIVIAGIVYAGFSYSQKTKLQTTPAGDTGSQATENKSEVFVFTADPAVPWIVFSQPEYAYTFSFPQTLPLYKFTDPPFSIGIKWNNVDPKYNMLVDQESIQVRDQQSVGNMEQFVNNWWKSFSGLTGIKSVTRFTNTNGLTGYRAIYINKAGETPNVDVFFADPNNPDRVVHFANGILEPTIFDRIIDSLKFVTATGTQSPSSDGQAVETNLPSEAPAQ